MLSITGKENQMSTTSIIILNAVLMFGIAAVVVSLCAGAIFTSGSPSRRSAADRHRLRLREAG